MGIKAPSEGGAQREVLDWLAARPDDALGVRVNSGARPWTDRKGRRRVFKLNSQEGCSDVLLCWRGRFVAVEVKAPGARTDPVRAAKQRAFAARVERAGGLALTVTSASELERDLREAGLTAARPVVSV